MAKNFDAPIKLLFPRDLSPGVEKPFSMLGLGDIVIPGVFVALLLRYDVLNSFKTHYFQRYVSHCMPWRQGFDKPLQPFKECSFKIFSRGTTLADKLH